MGKYFVTGVPKDRCNFFLDTSSLETRVPQATRALLPANLEIVLGADGIATAENERHSAEGWKRLLPSLHVLAHRIWIGRVRVSKIPKLCGFSVYIPHSSEELSSVFHFTVVRHGSEELAHMW